MKGKNMISKAKEIEYLMNEYNELRKGLSIIKSDGTYFYDEEKENRINSLILADTPEGKAFRQEYEKGCEIEMEKCRKFLQLADKLREIKKEV